MPGLFELERTRLDFHDQAEHLITQRTPDDLVPRLGDYGMNARLLATTEPRPLPLLDSLHNTHSFFRVAPESSRTGCPSTGPGLLSGYQPATSRGFASGTCCVPPFAFYTVIDAINESTRT